MSSVQSPVFFVYARPSSALRRRRIDRRTVAISALSSILSGGIGSVLFVSAIQDIGVGPAAILFATSPLFAMPPGGTGPARARHNLGRRRHGPRHRRHRPPRLTTQLARQPQDPRLLFQPPKALTPRDGSREGWRRDAYARGSEARGGDACPFAGPQSPTGGDGGGCGESKLDPPRVLASACCTAFGQHGLSSWPAEA